MKSGAMIRLGLAYALIATSGETRSDTRVSAPPSPRRPVAPRVATPTAIPTRRWLHIAKTVGAKINSNRVMAVAAGLTFYAILALFPAITALVSIYGLFADPGQIERNLSGLSGVVPDGALSVVGDQIKLISASGGTALGWAFAVGLGIALWSANSGMKALFDALNVAYQAKETRSFIRLNAVALLFTLSGIVLALAVLLGIVVSAAWALDTLSFGDPFIATVIRWLAWPASIAAALLGLAVVYRFGPDIERPEWKWVTPGSLFATFFLFVASAGFAYYAANFANYNKTYGTLGAAIGFMTWLWISSIVVMVGAELNAAVEREAKGKSAAPQSINRAPRS